MLCEECKVNEASYTISVMVGGEITTRHLCGDCMAKMNMDIASGNIKSLLSTILSAITGDTAPVSAGEQVVCPRCHLTLSEFTRTGHLGCPKCYEAFREQLQPMLLQIHGRVQHAGRRPLAKMCIRDRKAGTDVMMALMDPRINLVKKGGER